MRYSVAIQPSAERDVEEICEYLDQESEHLTEAWLDEYVDALRSLALMPRRCALAPESPSFDSEIRQLLLQPYRILFMIEGDEVHILHVRHHARDTLKPE